MSLTDVAIAPLSGGRSYIYRYHQLRHRLNLSVLPFFNWTVTESQPFVVPHRIDIRNATSAQGRMLLNDTHIAEL